LTESIPIIGISYNFDLRGMLAASGVAGGPRVREILKVPSDSTKKRLLLDRLGRGVKLRLFSRKHPVSPWRVAVEVAECRCPRVRRGQGSCRAGTLP